MERLSSLLVKDYLKTIIDCPDWYIGQMDKNKQKAIAIYANKREIPGISKFKELQTYSIIPITLLIRWTKNYNTAESKAYEVFDLLKQQQTKIHNFVVYINCEGEGPHDLGPDENGIYKFSIELNLTYKKGDA